MSPRPETLAIIAMLAQSTVRFHAVQLAHRVLCLTPAQQFTVRCRWRQLTREKDWRVGVCRWKLPSGRLDGEYIYFNWSTLQQYTRTYYVNGIEHGAYLTWYGPGRPNCQYANVCGKKCGEYKLWRKSGQLWRQRMYVDGVCYSFTSWDENGHVCSSCQTCNMRDPHIPHGPGLHNCWPSMSTDDTEHING